MDIYMQQLTAGSSKISTWQFLSVYGSIYYHRNVGEVANIACTFNTQRKVIVKFIHTAASEFTHTQFHWFWWDCLLVTKHPAHGWYIVSLPLKYWDGWCCIASTHKHFRDKQAAFRVLLNWLHTQHSVCTTFVPHYLDIYVSNLVTWLFLLVEFCILFNWLNT